MMLFRTAYDKNYLRKFLDGNLVFLIIERIDRFGGKVNDFIVVFAKVIFVCGKSNPCQKQRPSRIVVLANSDKGNRKDFGNFPAYVCYV